jgi:hypothetical protein
MLELLELLGCVLSFGLRVVTGPFDRHRIARFFEMRDERVNEIQWSPFSSGWLSNWYDRIYRVEYEASGVRHTAFCRTSWRTDVVIVEEDLPK